MPPPSAASPRPRFVRLGETGRPAVTFRVDGEEVEALAGDSLMVAILTHRGRLRRSEFGSEARAGFCLMAACQDCWVWTADGRRLRACDTPVSAGLSILTDQPEVPWPSRG
jgi:predicted molibdopterin-dependent oxidoreductase YjgC